MSIDTSKSIAIIDGNSLMHRAFHAVPTSMTAPDGRPTNAVFGFLSMLIKMIETFTPYGIIVAFDKGIPEFRLQAIEQYKSKRPPTDEDLKTQFPMVKELLEALDIPVVELAGWEGDDILGTLSTLAKAADIECFLVTGDKDALQLVNENTKVVNTRGGMSDVQVFDSIAVKDRWGVEPGQIPDLLGLMGDSSDNIPGVPGVGEKRARSLLEQYGSLDQVLANAQEVKGKLGENLRDFADLAIASRRAATIICDVPVDCDVAGARFPSYQVETVTKAFQKFALTSQLKKMLLFVEEGTAQPQEPPKEEAGIITWLSGDEAQSELVRILETPGRLAITIDDEASPVTLFSTNEPRLFCATENVVLGLGSQMVVENLASIYSSGRQVVAFDHKSILKLLFPADTSLMQELGLDEVDPARIFDCQIASYLLDSSKVPATLDKLVELHPQAAIGAEGLLAHAALDAAEADAAEAGAASGQPTDQVEANDYQSALKALALLRLEPILSSELQKQGASYCYEAIEKPLLLVLVQMERTGVCIDLDILGGLNKTLTARIDQLREAVIDAAGEEFNLDSPKQLSSILYDRLKLPTIKRTRTGYSTDASVLEELKSLHPLPGLMIEYRELAKLKSTYLDALPRLVANDGNIHTTFNQTVTATGRLSSSDPNLQNIPVRTDLGRQIRLAFVPKETSFSSGEACIVSADYSQIELRLLAHCSNDSNLVQSLIAGEDFHTMTAAQVWSIDIDQVTPELRNRAKAVNFGMVYGQQAYGLSQSLGVSFYEAQSLIDRYFETFPGVRDYLDKTVRLAHEQGWVETIFGRRRYIKELYSSNAATRGFGERTAMNHPMQGSAADIIKIAMIDVAKRIKADAYQAELIIQVHDELVFNCARDEVEDLCKMVKQSMEEAVSLRVPLTVEISSGANWAEAH
ncbi:MAG: DNA polymerase I [Coriobacteriia bacterium]|nr:DNA polymerase I [Coriobacteriia bacterium]